jgi:hypothetical protein
MLGLLLPLDLAIQNSRWRSIFSEQRIELRHTYLAVEIFRLLFPFILQMEVGMREMELARFPGNPGLPNTGLYSQTEIRIYPSQSLDSLSDVLSPYEIRPEKDKYNPDEM